jgi:heme/copper-type cytochrome/quinol oxidase subunit 2
MMKKIILFFVFLFSVVESNAQCAMCKAVVENGNEDMAEGINSGITYLMVVPYILVALLGVVLVRYRRKQKINSSIR